MCHLAARKMKRAVEGMVLAAAPVANEYL